MQADPATINLTENVPGTTVFPNPGTCIGSVIWLTRLGCLEAFVRDTFVFVTLVALCEGKVNIWSTQNQD